jgi:hypothetical protein
MLFRDFLPEVDDDGNILLWEEVARKDRDWCEEFLEDSGANNEGKYSMLQRITAGDITAWYERRIYEIEKLSGMTNYALDLGLLGLERNFLVNCSS